MYFILDLNGFYRFGFESSESPPSLFGPDRDVKRIDAIDAEIRASGITRQDEKELLMELSKTGENETNENESEDDSSEEQSEESDDNENNEHEPTEKNIPLEDIEYLKKEVDRSTAAAMTKTVTPMKTEIYIKDNEYDSMTATVTNLKIDSNEPHDIIDNAEVCLKSDHKDIDSISSMKVPSSRYAPSSVASTIAPEVIKARVKASLEKRKRNQQMKRIRTKGDTSAVTRQRNENKNEIKTSTDAFWAD